MNNLRVLMLDLKSYYPSPPFQLGLLVAYAKTNPAVANNIEFLFSEHDRERPAVEVAKAILKAEANLVAISSYAWNQKKIVDTLNLLTASGKKMPRILIGGPNVSGRLGEKMLHQYPVISALVEGEGEPAFLDICTSLVDSATKDPFLEARNCTFLDASGQIIRSNHGHRIGTLDEIPSPYLTGILAPNPSPLFYETNRGCPYRCSFCYWGNGNSKVYRLSVDRVREEMEFFAKKRVRALWLADANFGIFPSDLEIAQIMAEINERHGFPFRSVGVNWAKNSSDRILEIAETFWKGGMATSTTIALQTVSADAEKQSKRYSLPPAKFMHLLKTAHQKNIDTYTDIILGLPGENLTAFINGLDTVAATGVPCLKIHQLLLIPGTEFYDNKEKYGLKTIPETIAEVIPDDERSDYFDSTVNSHPKMSTKDFVRGRYFMGIIHLLHNHNLSQVVNLFLSRYGISNRDVFCFLEDLLHDRIPDFPVEKHQPFLNQLFMIFHDCANRLGLDDNKFYMKISIHLWFAKQENGLGVVNEPQIRAFMQDFYLSLCTKFNCCQTAEEKLLLAEMVDYNVLIAPKPTWRPENGYPFTYNVHQIAQDMQQAVFEVGRLLDPEKTKATAKENAWQRLSELIRNQIKELLTDDYLLAQKAPVTLHVKNPWGIPPSSKNVDWMLNSKSKHCVISVERAITSEDETNMILLNHKLTQGND